MRGQEHCNCCGKITLHEMDPPQVNHILHLLATLFLCGCWLPIWILLAIMEPTRWYRCTVCGQIAGKPSPQQLQMSEQERQRVIAANRSEAEARAAKRSEMIGAAADNAKRGVAGIGRAAVAAVRTVVAQIDSVVLRLSGEDAFMEWFFRAGLFLLMIVVGSAGLYAAKITFGW
jgi:hypothetical protein